MNKTVFFASFELFCTTLLFITGLDGMMSSYHDWVSSWPPTDSRNNKATVVQAIQMEYDRRGHPIHATGWCLNKMSKYLKFQFSMMQAGRVKEAGGFAFQLPKGTFENPADLPEEVEEFLKTGALSVAQFSTHDSHLFLWRGTFPKWKTDRRIVIQISH